MGGHVKGIGWVVATAGAISPWWGPPLSNFEGILVQNLIGNTQRQSESPGSSALRPLGGAPLPKIREGATWVGAPPFKYLAGLADRRHPDYAEIDDFPCAGNSGEQAIAICSTWR